MDTHKGLKDETLNSKTYRRLPKDTKPLDSVKIASLLEAEWLLFKSLTPKSNQESLLASDTMPLGVPSSFQHWDPYPISIESANGAYMTDVDGRKFLDLSMGFGAMLAGHLNPIIVSETQNALTKGMLFVTPSPSARDGAERICKRFQINQVRFANSGTEATMYAVRLAKTYTGRQGIVKIEGGYHGSFDPLMVSAKPSLDKAGDANAPTPVVTNGTNPGLVFVVPFNNIASLEKIFEKHYKEIACIIMEPVLENLAIVLPDEGYLEAVRALCDKYNVVLIFDEVKTGLTAGVSGAAKRLGVEPDLICLAKSIGGGLPVAAFGGKKKIMDCITNGNMPHFGTFNGNALVMSGVRAMDVIATEENLAKAERLNLDALNRIQDILDEYQLPAHTVGFGVKGCVTWSIDPVRNYRDYKATDFQVAELSWLFSLNRGIQTAAGLDEQWLISFAHTETEVDLLVENYRELAKAIRS